MIESKSRKPDLFDQATRVLLTMKLVFIDPILEVRRGYKTNALPTYLCWIAGIIVSSVLLFQGDNWILVFFHKKSILSGKFRNVLGAVSVFCGFIFWAYYRMGVRARVRQKLERVFLNSGLETRLKETPEFIDDFAIDEFTRKLRVRGRGLPLSSYKNARESLEHGLNVSVAKIENPGDNKEIVDIVYTTEKMPEIWYIDNLLAYKDFSFPIGRSYRGEIKATFRITPHFLIAGESGGGKSSFIRMMVTVLLINNEDLEVYFIDFKRGMENQVFEGFDRVTLIDNAADALIKLQSVNRVLDQRMTDFKNAKARNLEMYNRKSDRKGGKESRILVVVDEVSEMMPTVGGQHNGELGQVNSIMNRIARMGRAVGINLVVGVQKPDAKNLDTGVKANTSGIVCFPVSHFNQSMVILGNGRAADLNSELKGRAIWKQGADFVEVQTPLMTEKEVNDAREKSQRYWGKKPNPKENTSEQTVDVDTSTQDINSGAELVQDPVAVESAELQSDSAPSVQ